MRNVSVRAALSMAIVLLASTACGGNTGGGVPNASAGVQSAALPMSAIPFPLSGQYKGTFKDSSAGTGDAAGSFSQYKTTLGGSLTVTYSKETATDEFAASINGASMAGETVALVKTAYCAYSTTAAYDAKTQVLSGSYKAIYGCTGVKGTYALKQLCYYKSSTGKENVRREVGPKPC
jgi:hypothetical protein